ncbi:MAG TPA: IclR family transcriptional regulator [Pseudonocardiaceae bacterium]|nr:IclR family transcriptional regulator [Pseudonocardiaceae bacterium]
MNSIEKTLAVLRALSIPGSPYQLGAIAEAAELGKPTAHRILQVLVRNNYAEARGDGLYAPGLALRALGGGGGRTDLAETARPVLTELQQTSGHTVHFAVRAGRMAMYVSKIEGDKPYQMASRIGMQIRLHCTAIGKSVLSALPAADLDDLLAVESGDNGEPTGPAIDRTELDRQLQLIRKRGYAIDDQENEPNVRCVGAPVYGADGAVLGGVSVSGLTFVFSLKQAQALGPAVAATAARLSTVLGYPGGARP